ncbi:hypothetical protein ACNA6I_19920 [Rossellomorea sp. FS2]|uniref:hypothetical protein n=1 Tax=Rossellomorea sp. FS2 TaxID=3391447 RepID=UPI003A4E3B23
MIKIIEEIAQPYYNQLKKNGFIRGGHNGPYVDYETPVRNTAHWLIIFSYLYRSTEKDEYLEAVTLAGDYLTSSTSRPMKNTFYARTNKKKDFSNGVIGQAWAIEALCEIFSLTNNKIYLDIALEVYHLHPFDEKLGLWKTVNVDGSIYDYDMTINHQLWFAASGAILYRYSNDENLKEKLDIFFNKLDLNLNLYRNGLIKHDVSSTGKPKYQVQMTLRKLKYLKTNITKNKLVASLRYKEIGYHTFNVYALALIYSNGFNHEFFNSEKFKSLLEYAFSNDISKELLKNNHHMDISNLPMKEVITVNRYGYPYNPYGFEIPFIYKVFKNKLNREINVQSYIDKQMSLHYNTKTKSLDKNTEDAITLTSRIYELVRYL